MLERALSRHTEKIKLYYFQILKQNGRRFEIFFLRSFYQSIIDIRFTYRYGGFDVVAVVVDGVDVVVVVIVVVVESVDVVEVDGPIFLFTNIL